MGLEEGQIYAKKASFQKAARSISRTISENPGNLKIGEIITSIEWHAEFPEYFDFVIG